jgi:type II secretory pathway pseudopilin PulG
MIKLFRKTRNDLMEKNKTGQYFKYAIGEIVLVVIGILIALSINNWNEDQKKRKSERLLLSSIQSDIIQDTLDLGFNRSTHQSALESEILLLKVLNKDPNVKADSINYLNALSVQLLVYPHTSSFDNLTNNNPDLITNKKLKQKIDRHYDFFYTSLTEAENNQQEYNFYAKLLPYFKKYFIPSGEKIKIRQSANESKEFYDYTYNRNSLKPFDISAMQNDREFVVELSEIIFLRSVMISLYDEAFYRIKALDKDIEIELNKK